MFEKLKSLEDDSSSKRDDRLDFIRGVVMFFLVVVHIDFFSYYNFIFETSNLFLLKYFNKTNSIYLDLFVVFLIIILFNSVDIVIEKFILFSSSFFFGLIINFIFIY